MSSSYSELKFELIATGEQSGTWGNTTNTNIGTAINEAIAGMAEVTINGNTTLAWLNTSASQDARNYVLKLVTGAVSSVFDLVVPTIEKPYVVINATGHAATVKTLAGTGVVVPAGRTAALYTNGVGVTTLFDYVPGLHLGTPLAISEGGTGTDTVAAGLVASDGSVFSSVAAPTGEVVGTTDTQTLTNKTVEPRMYVIGSISGPSFSPNTDDYDMFSAIYQSSNLTFYPSFGTPFDGQKVIFRITASSTISLGFDAGTGGYRAIGVTLPTGVASGFTTYIGCIWNASISMWDVVAVNTGA